MTEKIIGITFGVAGEDGIDGKSSRELIKKQLQQIVNDISKNPPSVTVKVQIDNSDLKAQLAAIRKEIEDSLKGITVPITPKATGSSGSSGGSSGGEVAETKQKALGYDQLIKKLNALYNAKLKLSKADKDSLLHTQLTQSTQLMEASYAQQVALAQKNGTLTAKQVEDLEKYCAELEKVLAAEGSRVKLANDLAQSKLKNKAQSLYSDNGFDTVLKRNPSMLPRVDDLNRRINESIAGGGMTDAQLKDFNKEVIELQTQLKQAGVETDTLGNKFKDTFSSKLLQRFANILIALALNALRQVYENVLKINTALTELRIVTGATEKQMQSFAKTVTATAQKIGSSVKDLVESTTVYARLGYGLEEAGLLAEKTTIYSKVASVNVNDATQNITAIVKAFGIEAAGLESVLDQLIYVGNNYAISSSEIGEAMNNAASSLAANGNTLQEAIGIVTAANVTLQNVSRSSTAVRTIAARISGSTAELEELGEDIGSVLSKSKLDEQMRGFGVAITDANGELRSTYDILSDLHKHWDELNNTEQAAIANMLAGTRQQNAFYSIMQNWSDATNIVEQASKATGSLQTAQEQHLDSIQGKLDQLGATWEGVSQSLLDSGIVKLLLDILKVLGQILDFVLGIGDGAIPKIAMIVGAVTGVIALITKLKVIIGGLPAAFAALRTSLGITAVGFKGFFKVVGAELTKFLQKNAPILLITTIISLMTMLEGRARGFAEIIAGVISIVVTGIVVGLKTVGTAAKAFETSNFIGWIMLAISAVIALVKGIFDLIESFNPSYETLKETAQDAKKAWETVEEELDDVKDKLGEIQEQIDAINKKGSEITLVDRKELEYLEQEKANLESIAAMKEAEAARAKKQAAEAAVEAAGKYNSKHTVDNAPWWEWLLIGPFAFIHQGIAWGSDTQEEKLDKILKDYKSASEEDKDFVTSYLNELSDLTEGFTFGVSDEMDALLEQKFKLIDRYNLQVGDAALVWKRVLSDVRFSDEIEKLQELADSQGVSMDAIASAAPEFLQYLKDIGFYIDGDTESSNALIESIKELRHRLAQGVELDFTDDIELMQDKFNSLNNALKDIKNNGVISLDNIGKIIDSGSEGYPTLLKKYFKFVEGIGYQLADDWSSKSTTEILTAMAQDELKTYATALRDAQKTLENTSQSSEDYATAVKNVTVAQNNLNIKTTQWATIIRAQAIEEETDRLNKLKETLESQYDTYKELIDIRKDLLKTFKDELKYQKELAQKQQTVADLQTQLSIAQMDKSAAGQARARELQQKLSEAQDALDEYTLDKAVSDITAQLDEDAKEYKDFINEQVNKIVETINNLARDLIIDIDVGDTDESTTTSVTTSSNSGSSSSGGGGGGGGRYALQQYKIYHSGGFVGDVQSNEEFAKLLKGEFVATPRQMDNFIKEILPGTLAGAQQASTTITYNSPLVEISCGSIDESTVPTLRNLVDQAVAKIEKNMESALGRTGYKRKV